jgi:hypothetical protein
MKSARSRYHGHRAPEIISYAVWVLSSLLFEPFVTWKIFSPNVALLLFLMKPSDDGAGSSGIEGDFGKTSLEALEEIHQPDVSICSAPSAPAPSVGRRTTIRGTRDGLRKFRPYQSDDICGMTEPRVPWAEGAREELE